MTDADPDNEEPCEMLPWDTKFFGFPIAKVTRHWISPQRCEQIDAWCRSREVRCLYLDLASFGMFPTARVAEEAGFGLVDVKISMTHLDPEARRGLPPPGPRVRRATVEDLPALEEIAARSHRNTRFFNDEKFSPAKSEEMYRTWIHNDVRGGEKYVWAAVDEASVACGYCTCGISRDGNIGTIGLIAVDERVQRQGFGRQLVHASLHYFASKDIPTILLNTQAHSAAAQRLYQRCGFVTCGCVFAYHKWYDHG